MLWDGKQTWIGGPFGDSIGRNLLYELKTEWEIPSTNNYDISINCVVSNPYRVYFHPDYHVAPALSAFIPARTYVPADATLASYFSPYGKMFPSGASGTLGFVATWSIKYQYNPPPMPMYNIIWVVDSGVAEYLPLTAQGTTNQKVTCYVKAQFPKILSKIKINGVEIEITNQSYMFFDVIFSNSNIIIEVTTKLTGTSFVNLTLKNESSNCPVNRQAFPISEGGNLWVKCGNQNFNLVTTTKKSIDSKSFLGQAGETLNLFINIFDLRTRVKSCLVEFGEVSVDLLENPNEFNFIKIFAVLLNSGSAWGGIVLVNLQNFDIDITITLKTDAFCYTPLLNFTRPTLPPWLMQTAPPDIPGYNISYPAWWAKSEFSDYAPDPSDIDLRIWYQKVWIPITKRNLALLQAKESGLYNNGFYFGLIGEKWGIEFPPWELVKNSGVFIKWCDDKIHWRREKEIDLSKKDAIVVISAAGFYYSRQYCIIINGAVPVKIVTLEEL